MQNYAHLFQIPVMGTGHSVDTPIRVAPYGISSVVSIVDDLLLEKIRKYYCKSFDLPYDNIPRKDPDGRAKRITAYLETVQEIVNLKMEAIRNQPFFERNEKAKYFDLLPSDSSLRKLYDQLLSVKDNIEKSQLAAKLNTLMKPGSIDVNIMAKVDRITFDKNQRPLSSEFTDANAALRGYANSSLRSGLVLSAGFNPNLYGYLTQFRDFYRDKTGDIKKKIILKVSDFRSALIQGKYLAKKGLEVFEFRIESGLNCGGHAFPSDGHLLPVLLEEFKEKREQLVQQFQPLIEKFYNEMGWEYPERSQNTPPLITVQGGIGTNGELRRLMEDFGMDCTGWGSPFLLVPEATCVDDPTRDLLKEAGEDELYLSGVSPLGVPFNNIRNSGSEKWTKQRSLGSKPGSACPKGYLQSNTEFTENPICTASTQYQLLKIDQIRHMDLSDTEKDEMKQRVLNKSCLCDHLANGALIALGLIQKERAPQAICPGPNIAYFKGVYSLKEMVNHIYGRGKSLVSPDRPHMFAKEIKLYVDYFKKMIEDFDGTQKSFKAMERFKNNLENGMEFCLNIANRKPYKDENLDSIPEYVEKQKERLMQLFESLEQQLLVIS